METLIAETINNCLFYGFAAAFVTAVLSFWYFMTTVHYKEYRRNIKCFSNHLGKHEIFLRDLGAGVMRIPNKYADAETFYAPLFKMMGGVLAYSGNILNQWIDIAQMTIMGEYAVKCPQSFPFVFAQNNNKVNDPHFLAGKIGVAGVPCANMGATGPSGCDIRADCPNIVPMGPAGVYEQHKRRQLQQNLHVIHDIDVSNKKGPKFLADFASMFEECFRENDIDMTDAHIVGKFNNYLRFFLGEIDEIPGVDLDVVLEQMKPLIEMYASPAVKAIRMQNIDEVKIEDDPNPNNTSI